MLRLEERRSAERTTVTSIFNPLVQAFHMENMPTFTKPPDSISRQEIIETNSTCNISLPICCRAAVFNDHRQILTDDPMVVNGGGRRSISSGGWRSYGPQGDNIWGSCRILMSFFQNPNSTKRAHNPIQQTPPESDYKDEDEQQPRDARGWGLCIVPWVAKTYCVHRILCFAELRLRWWSCCCQQVFRFWRST